MTHEKKKLQKTGCITFLQVKKSDLTVKVWLRHYTSFQSFFGFTVRLWVFKW